MSQKLRIEIMDFKRAMMDMYRRFLLNKERVMINERLSPIKMEKPRHILPVRRIQYIRRLKREIVAIKLERLGEIRTIDTEMAEFMNRGGTRLKSQERPLAWFIVCGGEVADDLLG